MNKIAVLQESSVDRTIAERVLDLTSAAIYATDASGTITYFNEAAEKLWGVAPVLGETKWCGSWQIFTTDGEPLPHDRCPMATCLAAGVAANSEIVVRRPDGTDCNVLVSPRPIFDGQGKLNGAVNTLFDVTAERKAERLSARSDQLTQHLMASSQDCIKILDLEGRLRSINACGCRSLEVDDPGAAVGLSYFDFWTGEDRELARAAVRSAIETGAGRFSATYVTASGRETVWDEIVTVIERAHGKPEALVVISRDMTEHQRSAEQIARRLLQQRALTSISNVALVEESFSAVLRTIVEVTSDALDCPLVKVLEFTDSADTLLLRSGVGWKDGLAGIAHVGADRQSQAGYTLSVGKPVVVEDLRTETRFDGPPLLHEHGVRSGMSVTIPGPGARPYGVLGVHTPVLRVFEPADVDFLSSVANVIAARARQEHAAERRALLSREMAHRSGNLLQLASSVFVQTFRAATDIDEARETYTKRLAAMARANMTVARGGWGRMSLRTLAADSLEPFMDNVELSGRDIVLPPELCFDIGLIWHELSTNSAKYGAFSGKQGKVRIDWNIRPENGETNRLTLSWADCSETDKARRNGGGFGTKLLSQIVERKYAGKIEIQDTPKYRCEIEMVYTREPNASQ